MDFRTAIANRRDGARNTSGELAFLARGAADGTIPDYQLAAWLMAAYLRPLDPRETADLTRAMADSGEKLDLSALPEPCIDKHSTGGVGDKTSIALMPLLAACGATVVKMSGRGLGITGGTVDKLGSVPGFRLDFTPDEMLAQAAKIGLAITGQTPRLAPADGALYALRDATATVGSISLIVSSILSKKLAGGAKTVIIDVKCGSGAFMRELSDARELAEALRQTGELCGLKVITAISDMSQPLGSAIGNAVEVQEAIDLLCRRSRSRFRDFVLRLAGICLHGCGLAESRREGEIRAAEAIESRAAEFKARQWFEAQGGALDPFERADWSKATAEAQLRHEGPSGWIGRIDASVAGQVALELGAGRLRKEDPIDPTVGLRLHVEVGSPIAPGEIIATVLARSPAEAERAVIQLKQGISFSPDPVDPIPVILEEP
jgi:pyrimidine-nucleoside phosphorylase